MSDQNVEVNWESNRIRLYTYLQDQISWLDTIKLLGAWFNIGGDIPTWMVEHVFTERVVNLVGERQLRSLADRATVSSDLLWKYPFAAVGVAELAMTARAVALSQPLARGPVTAATTFLFKKLAPAKVVQLAAAAMQLATTTVAMNSGRRVAQRIFASIAMHIMHPIASAIAWVRVAQIAADLWLSAEMIAAAGKIRTEVIISIRDFLMPSHAKAELRPS